MIIKNKKSFLLLIGVLTLFCSSDILYAQQTTLRATIKALEEKYHVTFSYDSDLLEKVPFSFPKDTSGFRLKGALEYISSQSAFQVQAMNDSIFILKPRKEGINYFLKGKILDEATQEAMSGCTVSSQPKKYVTITDSEGNFELPVLFNPTDTVIISFIGYQSIKIPYTDFANSNPRIQLKEEILQSDEVTVTAYLSEGIRFDRLNNAIQVKPTNMALLPGQTDADLLLSLDALPGVNTPDSRAGNLNIRGSSPDQNLIMFDNIPIYHKGHYFGTLSPFNPKVVENLNITRSNFTADKGGRAGGAIDIKTKQKVPDSVLTGVGISTADASLYTNIPIIKNKVGLMLAGRTSYPTDYPTWFSPKLKSISDFVFQLSDISRANENSNYQLQKFRYQFYDVNAKLIVQPTTKHTISVSTMKIFNRLNTSINNIRERSISTDSIRMSNWGVSGKWNGQWTKKLNTSLTVTKSYYNQDFLSLTKAINPDTISKNNNYVNTVNDLDIAFETTVQSKKKNFLKLGYNLHQHLVSYSDSKFSIRNNSLFTNSNNGYIHSLYSSYNLAGLKRLRASIGLRGNYYTVTSETNLEPRITVNYFITDTWSVKSSAGIQKQFISQVLGFSIESYGGLENLLWVLADGKGIPTIVSNQVMVGAMYEKKNWLIDIEFYHRVTNNVTVLNINRFTNINPFYYGNTYATGMDLLVRKDWKRIDAWVSYSLSKANMKIDSIINAKIPALYDQRHVLDIAGTYKWNRWKFSAGWKYRSGLAALVGIRSKLIHGPGTSSPQGPAQPRPPITAEEYNNDRYAAFHQLDISVVHSFPAKQKKWNASIGLSILNVYNQKNTIEQVPVRTPTGNKVVTIYSLGITPNLLASFNF